MTAISSWGQTARRGEEPTARESWALRAAEGPRLKLLDPGMKREAARGGRIDGPGFKPHPAGSAVWPTEDDTAQLNTVQWTQTSTSPVRGRQTAASLPRKDAVASRTPECSRHFLACRWSVDCHQHACSPPGAEGTRRAHGVLGLRRRCLVNPGSHPLGVVLAIFQVPVPGWRRLVRLPRVTA